MFSSPIGRISFLVYSVVLFIGEIVAVLISIAGTIGLDRLANSRPGSGRAGLALACFIVMMLFVAARANLAWRRGRDADLTKWLTVPYIIFLALFAALQALTLLIYDFNKESSNPGLGLLGLALFVLWFRLCTASPKGGSFDPDAFMAREGLATGPGDRAGRNTAASIPMASPIASPRAALVTGRRDDASPIVFGKRGRA
jgi:uncharacterized membrane protein YhaH (DUF805 family)